MKKLLIIISSILFQCSMHDTNTNYRLFTGLYENVYYEYWFYDSLLFIYDDYSEGLGMKKYSIRNDSLILNHPDNKLFKAYRMEEGKNKFILVNSEGHELTLRRYKKSLKLDAMTVFEHVDTNHIKFINQAREREKNIYNLKE